MTIRSVIVCGGRYYRDRDGVYTALGSLLAQLQAEQVVQGGASGADEMAADWCEENSFPCVTVPAKWDQYGKAAGPLRNQLMLDRYQPVAVIAFPGAAGTADMIRKAERAGVPVFRAGCLTA